MKLLIPNHAGEGILVACSTAEYYHHYVIEMVRQMAFRIYWKLLYVIMNIVLCTLCCPCMYMFHLMSKLKCVLLVLCHFLAQCR